MKNVKFKRLLENIEAVNLCDLSLGKGFSKDTKITTQKRKKSTSWTLSKLKSCFAKDTAKIKR